MKKKIILSICLLVFVVAMPLTVKATDQFSTLDIVDHLYNSVGKFLIKDAVKITKSLLVKKNLNVKGEIKNTATSTPVTVDDNLKVKGNITLTNDGTVDGVDVSSLSNLTNAISPSATCTEGQVVKYNATNSTWDCSTDQATITESSMTIGSGLSLSDTNELSVSDVTTDMITNATIGSADLASDSVGASALSSSAISAGDVEAGDLPSGGTWTLSSDLIINPSTNALVIGTGAEPPSRTALYVADNVYAQFAFYAVSEPIAADCNEAREIGRQYIFKDGSNYVLAICFGANGWKYVDFDYST